MCSFIAYDFMSRINDTIEPLGYDVCVSMHTGGIMGMSTVMRNCPIIIDGITLHANLIVIHLREFDVIL